MYTSERFIQRFLLEKFRVQFRKVDARRSENIVLDINKDCTAEQKRILVCYLDYGRSSYSLRHNVEHTNSQEMCQIIKVLIDMNFRIDVCDCANKEAIYDVAPARSVASTTRKINDDIVRKMKPIPRTSNSIV